MVRVALSIDEATPRMTLKAILEAAGHRAVDSNPDVCVVDMHHWTSELTCPVLLLVRVGEVPGAIRAMREGAFGYILLPFQPGEAELMVSRAVSSGASKPAAHSEPPMISLAEVEAIHIRAVLRQCKNNQAKAARILGIGRNTLWRKLKTIASGEDANGG